MKYVPNGNPQPRNGRVIGHIIDGQYVPVQEKTASTGADMPSYGPAALVRSVTSDLMSELLAVYPAQDACSIMAIAALRVIKPAVTARRLSSHYELSFIYQQVLSRGCTFTKHCLHPSEKNRCRWE